MFKKIPNRLISYKYITSKKWGVPVISYGCNHVFWGRQESYGQKTPGPRWVAAHKEYGHVVRQGSREWNRKGPAGREMDGMYLNIDMVNYIVDIWFYEMCVSMCMYVNMCVCIYKYAYISFWYHIYGDLVVSIVGHQKGCKDRWGFKRGARVDAFKGLAKVPFWDWFTEWKRHFEQSIQAGFAGLCLPPSSSHKLQNSYIYFLPFDAYLFETGCQNQKPQDMEKVTTLMWWLVDVKKALVHLILKQTQISDQRANPSRGLHVKPSHVHALRVGSGSPSRQPSLTHWGKILFSGEQKTNHPPVLWIFGRSFIRESIGSCLNTVTVDFCWSFTVLPLLGSEVCLPAIAWQWRLIEVP